MLPQEEDTPLRSATPRAAAGWLQLLLLTSQAGRRLRRELATAAEAVGASEQELLALWLCRYPPAAPAARGHPGSRGNHGSQGELAQWLGISPAQMSTVIERLRGHGWLSVQRQGLDRRRHQLEVSPAGEAVLAAAADRLATLAEELQARLTNSAQENLLSSLALLAESPRPAAAGAAA